MNESVYAISRVKCFWFPNQGYHNNDPLWFILLCCHVLFSLWTNAICRPRTRVASIWNSKHIICQHFSQQNSKWKENSIISRGTGSNMNAKLIKGRKITRITEEQKFELIVWKSATHYFNEVLVSLASICFKCQRYYLLHLGLAKQTLCRQLSWIGCRLFRLASGLIITRIYRRDLLDNYFSFSTNQKFRKLSHSRQNSNKFSR